MYPNSPIRIVTSPSRWPSQRGRRQTFSRSLTRCEARRFSNQVLRDSFPLLSLATKVLRVHAGPRRSWGSAGVELSLTRTGSTIRPQTSYSRVGVPARLAEKSSLTSKTKSVQKSSVEIFEVAGSSWWIQTIKTVSLNSVSAPVGVREVDQGSSARCQCDTVVVSHCLW